MTHFDKLEQKWEEAQFDRYEQEQEYKEYLDYLANNNLEERN